MGRQLFPVGFEPDFRLSLINLLRLQERPGSHKSSLQVSCAQLFQSG